MTHWLCHYTHILRHFILFFSLFLDFLKSLYETCHTCMQSMEMNRCGDSRCRGRGICIECRSCVIARIPATLIYTFMWAMMAFVHQAHTQASPETKTHNVDVVQCAFDGNWLLCHWNAFSRNTSAIVLRHRTDVCKHREFVLGVCSFDHLDLFRARLAKTTEIETEKKNWFIDLPKWGRAH